MEKDQAGRGLMVVRSLGVTLAMTAAVLGPASSGCRETHGVPRKDVGEQASLDVGSAGFEPYVVENECRYFVDQERDTGIFSLKAVLQGVSGSDPAAMLVRGSCRYVNKDDPNLKFRRSNPGWSCDFTTYRVFSVDAPELPVVVAQDFRGPFASTDYWGEKPQPSFQDRTISLNEFSIEGPGRLSLACPNEVGPTGAPLEGCKIAWYNEFVPESTNFHGTCGDRIPIPGFFVSSKKND